MECPKYIREKNRVFNKGKLKMDNKKIISEKLSAIKELSKEKVLPAVKNATENTKEVITKVSDKIKVKITEKEMLEILNTLYVKSINGIPKVSLPIDDLVEDYISKNPSVESAAKSLINNSIVKCGTSGFITGFGGFATMIATLPANITSVLYVQLRMCCAIAKMAGYDIYSDQVQTLIYACLTGSAINDILKQAGIKFVNKFGVAMVKKIPGKTLTVINRKVGFKFVTKFGEKGILNLGKAVPVLGAVVGGGMDVASTRIIGYNAYKIFVKEELPTNDEVNLELTNQDKTMEVDDVDTKMLKNAIKDVDYSVN